MFLVAIGLIIGLIIGFVLLLIIIGGLNAGLTSSIWDISIKTDWKSLLAHGFVLFITLLLARIPSYIVDFMAPGLAIEILVFVIYCFIDGFIAKNIAVEWGKGYEDEVISQLELETQLDVPYIELYKKMLLDYVLRYGSITGKSMLNAHIKDYLKKGLSIEEAIMKLAETGGYGY